MATSHVDAVVLNVNSRNQGIYTCTSGAISSSSTLTIRSEHYTKCQKTFFGIFLIYLDRPVLDASKSLSLVPRSFLYGSPFNLSCNASGEDIEWRWYHNGLRLSASTSTLIVPSPTLADTGIYQCFAYNPVANVSAAGNITILSESGPFIIFFLH